MPTADYTVYEGFFTVTAEVRYARHSAYGDGWTEPHEPAHVEIYGAKLVKHTAKHDWSTGKLVLKWPTEDLGDAPEWVMDIIKADTDWQSDLLHDEPEYEREDV